MLILVDKKRRDTPFTDYAFFTTIDYNKQQADFLLNSRSIIDGIPLDMDVFVEGLKRHSDFNVDLINNCHYYYLGATIDRARRFLEIHTLDPYLYLDRVDLGDGNASTPVEGTFARGRKKKQDTESAQAQQETGVVSEANSNDLFYDDPEAEKKDFDKIKVTINTMIENKDVIMRAIKDIWQNTIEYFSDNIGVMSIVRIGSFYFIYPITFFDIYHYDKIKSVEEENPWPFCGEALIEENGRLHSIMFRTFSNSNAVIGWAYDFETMVKDANGANVIAKEEEDIEECLFVHMYSKNLTVENLVGFKLAKFAGINNWKRGVKLGEKSFIDSMPLGPTNELGGNNTGLGLVYLNLV